MTGHLSYLKEFCRMRSIYVPTILSQSDEFCVEDKSEYHHLVNVVRIKIGEQVLFLNGLGTTVICEVISVSKKSISFKKIETNENVRCNNLILALCQTKKDALDEIIKSSVELGFKKIYLLESDFSQRYPLNRPRIDKLIVSAMEQSNNPFFLEVVEEPSFSVFVEENKDSLIYFSASKSLKAEFDNVSNKMIMLIGPEGGLSGNEEALLKEYNVPFCHFDTKILRSKTAIACAAGYLMGCAHSN
jgi:16S rRNA (uracil1498-N3)-methyltransferase